MTAPRLEIDVGKIHHNARVLIDRLATQGIEVCGVTKATLGAPDVARAFLDAGVTSLGDSRIENIEAMRRAGVVGPMTLIRSPMLSQVDRVVAAADMSLNTEVEVVRALAAAATARGGTHRVVLMVELGDLREGIMPGDLVGVVGDVLSMPGVALAGIGTNLACQSGVSPDAANMGELSALVGDMEARFGLALEVVSGGNSANLDWALGPATAGRVNHLRLGEALLLGREPLHRRPVAGLHTDAFTLTGEVIESRSKPSLARGTIAQTAFGAAPDGDANGGDSAGDGDPCDRGDRGGSRDRGDRYRTIVALGRQDVDPAGLVAPAGIEVIGASSDHLVVDTGQRALLVGAEVSFGLDYSALVRAMTSPFVAKVVTGTYDERGAPAAIVD